jgi:hypothetical protein
MMKKIVWRAKPRRKEPQMVLDYVEKRADWERANRQQETPASAGAVTGDLAILAEWKSKVDAKKAAGKSQADAIRETVRENPTLHREYLAAFGRQAAGRRAGHDVDAGAFARCPAPARAVAPQTYGDPIAEYEQEVQRRMRAGATRQAACRAIANEAPELSVAMVNAHNARFGRPGLDR